ncbi:hypothetical protein [Amycolatopsis sp. DSM 110486]|uniref:hypothetical protein n=1 Tax=Amycolatopsis sp. DSM 110486 TaxID=2865832 RepID=UPI001C6A222D|nr:hypothetical protein [Amycolatopsis sp. DSM 110486]QYN20406.1 hypothetical protein K1T34_49260 [Amycolatopsis sp. DSM 110486]
MQIARDPQAFVPGATQFLLLAGPRRTRQFGLPGAARLPSHPDEFRGNGQHEEPRRQTAPDATLGGSQPGTGTNTASTYPATRTAYATGLLPSTTAAANVTISGRNTGAGATPDARSAAYAANPITTASVGRTRHHATAAPAAAAVTHPTAHGPL